jgi:CheY-like chemotaxis protein
MPTARVLIVDDDPAARRLYGAFLRSKGMETHEAESGIEAVQRVEQTTYDLVLMDLDMPGIDGWMAMSLIRARLPKLPMVILTAMSGSDFKDRAAKLGVHELLHKPCAHDDLLRTVERALSHGK